ncbi:hypothetical protein QL285_072476 [Trifolium repens]|nr:hypothetical protein QL285_072476 [Trifolium repens]
MVKSQIDPAKEKQLQGAKITEFEYNVKRILKLIRDGDRDMDGTREKLAELIEDIYNQELQIRMVTHLKHKVEDLMKLIKEKEEGLGGEKREAIRQLCLRIDYLREYNDDLKEIISKSRNNCCLW